MLGIFGQLEKIVKGITEIFLSRKPTSKPPPDYINKDNPKATHDLCTPLPKHSLFNTLKEERHTVKHLLQLDNKVKELVLKDVLLKIIDVVGNRCVTLARHVDEICKGDNCTNTCALSYEKFISINTSTWNEIDQEIQSHVYSNDGTCYTEEEKRMLAIVLERLSFRQNPCRQLVKNTIEVVKHTQEFWYCTKVAQANVFRAYESCVYQLVQHAMLVGNDLNGELDGGHFDPTNKSYPNTPFWLQRLENEV